MRVLWAANGRVCKIMGLQLGSSCGVCSPVLTLGGRCGGAQIEALNTESYVRPYFAGTHVFPAFPGAAASFISPVCTDVGLLEKGQAEGRAMVMRLFGDGSDPEVAAPGPPAIATPLAGLPV